MNKQEHWENVYRTKARDEVSWFREHLDTSLQMIADTGVGKDAAIIDVGGGNSTLVEDLIDQGFTDLTVLDISASALDTIRTRLGDRAAAVTWTAADITQVALPENRYDLWHDRAVFHFMTDPQDRQLYLANLERALSPGGHVILGTFADDGPQKCSGLDVERYDIEKLKNTIGGGFELVSSFREQHETPSASMQSFLYAHFRKAAGWSGASLKTSLPNHWNIYRRFEACPEGYIGILRKSPEI